MQLISKFKKKIKLKTAVLFLAYNRPDNTLESFKSIRQIKPARLYVAIDGPRKNFKDDKENVAKVKKIFNKIDWPCKLKTLFRNKNLGCKKAVSEAISWFFNFEEQGIILEDDCLANQDFFHFCENLLNRFKEDDRVACITGNNFQNNQWRGDSSYYFSKYNHCWGWATWRRAWKNYQGDLAFWPKWKKSNSWLNQTFDNVERKYWESIFNKVYNNKVDSWAYPWTASVWYKGGLTATPNVNLVSNIGFGDKASHTSSKNSKFSKMPIESLSKIKHVKKISRDTDADLWVFDNHYEGKYLRFPYNLILIRAIRYFLNKLKDSIKFFTPNT